MASLHGVRRVAGVSAYALALASGVTMAGLVACGSDDSSDSAPSGEFGGGKGGSTISAGGSSGTGAGGSSGTLSGTGGAGGGAGSGGSAGGTNVNLGGAQDCGYFRTLLESNQVPQPGDCDAAGFFAEHHTPLPPASCGNRVCLQPMLGVMGNLLDGSNCTMLHVGLNSPIAADPNQRPPLSLAVVVDVSGSMNEANKISFVREGLGLLIDGLKDGDRFALITYSDGARVDFPMREIGSSRVEARSLATSLVANGATNFYAGLEAGYHEVIQNYDSGRQNRVIMMSDGQPTAGNTSETAIIDMSRGYNSDGIGLTTIGLGTSFNARLMRDLALQADGNFYFLENSAAVNEVFTQELSYFTVPVAFDLTMNFATSAHYSFGRAYGSPLWRDTAAGGSLDVPSVFLAHRESDDDVTPGGGRRGGGSALIIEVMPKAVSDDGSGANSADVATVDVQFREPGTNRIVTDSVTVNFPYPPWTTPTNGYFDSPDIAIVQKSFVMLNIYVGIDRAVTEFHRTGRPIGDVSRAVGQLDRLIASVEDYNQELEGGQGDTDMKFDLELLRKLRAVMIANAVPEPTENDIPDDPWPAD
jgi:Ca-activated chloride channel homolog